MILFMTIFLLATSASGLAFMFAGFLAPYLTHVTKNYFGANSMWAYTIHLVSSLALSALSLFATGEFTLDNVVDTTARVAVMSQTIFQVWKQGSGLTVEPTKVEELEQ